MRDRREWVARGRVDAKPELRALLAGVAARVFLGLESPADIARLDASMGDIWRGMLAPVRNPWLSPSWRRAIRAYRSMMADLVALVAARREHPTADLLGRVANSSEPMPDGTADDAARAAVVFNVMLGAFDTTSSGLTSAVFLLAKHPEWQEKIRTESRAFGPRRLTFEETRSLVSADRVWKETLRLFPVAGAPIRVALRDTTLSGFAVPAGANTGALAYLQHFDSRFWTAPDTFDPDRFSPERAEEKSHKAAYLPFGAGPHTCIGMQLANAEAKLLLHMLVTRCRFRLARDYEGTHRFEPLGSVSGKVALVLEPIDGA